MPILESAAAEEARKGSGAALGGGIYSPLPSFVIV
jgi:hypothetical protein